MDNGCVENQHAVFKKHDFQMRHHLKPLFIQAKVNGVGVNIVLIDGGATVNLLPQSFLKKISIADSDLKPHNVVLSNYEGTSGNSLGAIEVELMVGSVTTRFSLDLFYYLFMCGYMCFYVINCLYVYFGLGLVDFSVIRVLWSF